MFENACQFLRFMEASFGDRTAFRFVTEDGIRSVSYREYAADVRSAALQLKAEFPNTEGMHIAILSRNSYRYAVILPAIMLADAVPVLINREESLQTIAEQLTFADTECVFVSGEFLQEHPAYPETAGIPVKCMDRYGEGCTGTLPEGKTDGDGLQLMLYTSGTTGTSKCVMLARKNLWRYMKTALPKTGCESCFFSLPLYHIGGVCHLLDCLVHGCLIFLNSSTKYLKTELLQSDCSHTSTVPALMQFLSRSLKKGNASGSLPLKSICTGAAKLDPALSELFCQNGIKVIQAYGLSESCALGATHDTIQTEKKNSVGKADNGCEILIVDGEICIRGDCVMLGYYKNPEATAAALEGGMLHTGDLGYIDEDGYVYITGRKKNLIILSSGENVSPEELESELLKSPLIEEVVVKERDRSICAEIYCAAQAQGAAAEYVEQTNRRLAYYKHISRIEFRSEPFPRTATGKIRRGAENTEVSK